MSENNNSSPPPLYHYDPSLVAAAVAAGLFGLTTLFHTYQLLRTRTWYMIPLVIGGVFECLGYIGRALNSEQSPNWSLGIYIMQSLLILLAPALFAASTYMTLGRIIRAIGGEDRSMIKSRWLTKIFVAGDVFSFLIQGNGGGMMAQKKPDSRKAGSYIIVGGLILQLAFFGFFLIVAVCFDRAIRKRPTTISSQRSVSWYKYLIALYLVSTLILVRSVSRIVEFVQGNTGYMLGHEWVLYTFDGLLMLMVLLTFNVIYPGNIKALSNGDDNEKDETPTDATISTNV